LTGFFRILGFELNLKNPVNPVCFYEFWASFNGIYNGPSEISIVGRAHANPLHAQSQIARRIRLKLKQKL